MLRDAETLLNAMLAEMVKPQVRPSGGGVVIDNAYTPKRRCRRC